MTAAVIEEPVQECSQCGADLATIEFGVWTAWAGQHMCRRCAGHAFREIIDTTPEPNVREFMARAQRYFPGAKIVSDSVPIITLVEEKSEIQHEVMGNADES